LSVTGKEIKKQRKILGFDDSVQIFYVCVIILEEKTSRQRQKYFQMKMRRAEVNNC
jgi:hypothetical protein